MKKDWVSCRSSKCWLNLAAVFCLMPFRVFAETADAIDNIDLPVVLTASRMRQPLAEAPVAVTVIDRTMIEASGVRQVADLLRLVPGAIVGYEDGNRPVVSLRGMTGVLDSGLQVLIDGVSVYSPVFGGMYWASLPISLDDIERIEVVRGPNAASYGANSFHGVVNIITREPGLENGFAADANLGGGGIHDTGIHGAGGGHDWHYRATLAQRYDTGFDSRPDTQRWTYSNLRGDYRVDAENSIDFSLRWGDERKDVGEYASPDVLKTPYSQFNNQLQWQVRWNWAESSDREWWVQAYHQRMSHLDRFTVDLSKLSPVPLPFALPYEVEQDFLTQRDGVEFQSLTMLSPTSRLVWGGEWRRDAVFSGRFFSRDDELAAFLERVFANFEWRLAPGWLLNAGTMFERNTLADNAWSPRVAIIREIAPGQTLRASLSRAKRTPTLIEKYGNERFVSLLGVSEILDASGEVKSESVSSREIGYVFNAPDIAFSGDARWFSDRYTGLVSIVGNPPIVGNDAVNSDEAKTTGLDLTLNWQPLLDTRVRLAAARSNTTGTDNLAISVPKETLSLLLTQSFANGWLASVNYQRVSSMHWTDSGQRNLKIPAIDHLNLRVAKKFSVGAQEIEFAGVMQNALGHYREYYLGGSQGTPDNVAKRLAYVQLSIRY